MPFSVPVLDIRASAGCGCVFVATGGRVDAFANAAPHHTLLRLEPSVSAVTCIALGGGGGTAGPTSRRRTAAPPQAEVLYIGGKNGELGALNASEAVGWRELVITHWAGQSETDRTLAVALPWLTFIVSA